MYFSHMYVIEPVGFSPSQRHGIRGDVRIEKIGTQPLKIVSNLAAESFSSRASTAKLLHCIK